MIDQKILYNYVMIYTYTVSLWAPLQWYYLPGEFYRLLNMNHPVIFNQCLYAPGFNLNECLKRTWNNTQFIFRLLRSTPVYFSFHSF